MLTKIFTKCTNVVRATTATVLAAAACAAVLVAASPAAASPIGFTVVVNTAPLVGNAAGPFSLNFQLNDGSGLPGGGVNNTATISNFNFYGGNAVGLATLSGSASGDLSSGISLSDSSSFSDFVQGFNPGSLLSFFVQLSRNIDGPAPDAFVFGILDGALFNIPTTGLGDALVLVNINSATLGLASVQTFRGLNVQGGPNYSAVTTQAVPEPASLLLLGAGIIGLLATPRLDRRRRDRSSRL